jgi:hypothetical protein
MDAGRLRALVIGGAAAATLAVGGVVAASPLPDRPAAPPPDPAGTALGSLEARAARDLARAEAALRNQPAPIAAGAPAPAVVATPPAPIVTVTQAAPVTQSTSS